MAKITLDEQETILTFPTDSILELKIEEATVRTVQGRNGDWQKVEFKFKVLGIQALGDGSRDFDPYDNWITKDIYGSIPFRLTNSPENKLRIWAEAIFRQELGLGFELDTDLFVGRKVRGLTSRYESKARGADGAPLYRHQIETLLPASDQAQPAAPVVSGAPTAGPSTGDPWGNNWKSEEPPF